MVVSIKDLKAKEDLCIWLGYIGWRSPNDAQWKNITPLWDEIAALRAENARLRETLEDCRAYFEASWQSVNKHPASHYAGYVLDINDALGLTTQPEEAGA